MSPVTKVERSWAHHDKEILKYGVSLDGVPRKSVVLDATAFPAPTPPNQVTWVEAGTVLMKTADGKHMKPYDGVAAATIEGILYNSVAIWVNTTAGMEPAAMLYRDVVFATASIVNFTAFAADLLAESGPMANCGWE